MGLCCLTIRTYTKFMTNLSRGVYKSNLLDNMTKARLSATLALQNTKMLNKLTNRNTWSRFTLLLDHNSNHWTPNLAILFGKLFDCLKSLPKNLNTVPKPIVDHFGRWHSRQESLRNHKNVWFSRKLWNPVQCLAQVSSLVELWNAWRRVLTEPRHKGH